MNSLNLIFGPKLPPEFDSVGLTFIASPQMQPDTSIASLSAERYAKENYSTVQEEIFLGIPDGQLSLSCQYITSPITFVGDVSGPYAYNLSGILPVVDAEAKFSILSSPISIIGNRISKAGTWLPIIRPGTFWRRYVLTDLEPADSWLRQAGFVEDDTLFLLYSVPELHYQSSVEFATLAVSSTQLANIYPFNKNANGRLLKVREVASVTGPSEITYAEDLAVLTQIYVNKQQPYTQALNYTGTESHEYVKELDRTHKAIKISKSLHPDDLVELEYYAYGAYYIYSGFRNASGTWFSFDANPEYGHLIGDDTVTGTGSILRHSSECLMEQVTVYAYPTAAMKITASIDPMDGNPTATLSMSIKRACEYGETHFIRHAVTGERSEKINSLVGAGTVNTWGYGIAGKNYYDQTGTFITDVFSDSIPSMVPLGSYVLAAPASINSASILDIRKRGGGVPEDFEMVAVSTQASGLDTLKGFYDLGNWEGAMIKDGGVVKVEIDKTVLKTSDTDIDPTHFSATEIYEIVKNQLAPGIDFEIVYV